MAAPRTTPAKLSRREQSKADKMRRILAAGEKLFSKQGFDGTTVQQIADEADVAVGTLFLYVSDKNELLLRVFYNATARELGPSIRRMKANRKFLPGVRRFLTDLMTLYEVDRDLSKVYVREVLFHKGGVRAELDQQAYVVVAAIAESIVIAQAKGQIDKRVNPATSASLFYSIFHATLAFHIAECLPGTTPRQTIKELLQAAWVGMAPRP